MPKGDVEFANVSYTSASGHVLLHDISLRLESGTTTALLGRSGAGKTTLLRMVNRLASPTSGRVLVDGLDIEKINCVELRRRIGYVIQETGLFPHMTVERNTGLALEIGGRPRSEIRSRAKELLGLVGLDYDQYRERYPRQLSGGQKQRVGLARALASDPEVLLMDEPFGALDPLTRVEMRIILKDLLKRLGKTALLVTHDLHEAMDLADRVVFLDCGKMMSDLPVSEVFTSDNVHVKAYVAAVYHRTER
jgi:osmoprotectant transport system ATP-binding protein